MKKLAVLLLVLTGLTGLSGCVVYPAHYDEGRGYRHQGGAYQGYYGDRDGDGVRDRYDRYPYDPHRY